MTRLAVLLHADRPYAVRRIRGRWACIPVNLPAITTWHDTWADAYLAAEEYAAAARRVHANRETS
ncbi:MAG: hypothetical protein ACRCSL_01205 [Microbacterium sp.]